MLLKKHLNQPPGLTTLDLRIKDYEKVQKKRETYLPPPYPGCETILNTTCLSIYVQIDVQLCTKDINRVTVFSYWGKQICEQDKN